MNDLSLPFHITLDENASDTCFGLWVELQREALLAREKRYDRLIGWFSILSLFGCIVVAYHLL